jgi:hypothetical protein
MKLPLTSHRYILNLPSNPLGRVVFGIVQVDWIGTGFHTMRQWSTYQLVLVLDGSGHYRDVTGRNFPLKKGDLFLTSPDASHQYGPPEGKVWSEFGIGFIGDLFDLWHRAGILKPQDKPIPLADSLSRWYQKFDDILTPTPLERQHSVRHLIRLLGLLEQLPLHHPRLKRSCGPEWVNHAVDILASSDLSQLPAVSNRNGRFRLRCRDSYFQA